jgi:beta-phosphoglucomutase
MNASLLPAYAIPASDGTLKACLFDLDGVIIDTAKYHFIAWREIATELGFDFTERNNERLKGVSRTRSLDILLEVGRISLGDAEKARLAQEKNARYLQYVSQIRPEDILPGAREFLIECRNSNLKTALGSASKNAMAILNLIQMGPLFDAIVDGNKVSKVKPDPEVFLTAARELGVLPQDCAVFEDAEAGIEAALAAKMLAVGIGDPVTLRKAHFVASGLNDLSVKMLVAEFERSRKSSTP